VGVGRLIWQRVLAFDRVGSRIPQLVQIWLLEFFFAMPLAFFIGKAIDIRGAFGVPGTGEKLDGTFWGSLVVAVIAGFFFVRSLVKPRIVEGSWAPVARAKVGDFTVFASNEPARVNYVYLTSHPSYALLLLIIAPIPAVMALATINQGDSTFYWRITGIVGLIILSCLARSAHRRRAGASLFCCPIPRECHGRRVGRRSGRRGGGARLRAGDPPGANPAQLTDRAVFANRAPR